jgi:uncharacterized protein (DUF1810 family)
VSDLFRLERFIEAQNQGGTYDLALGELRRGRKTSHWMWFVFPQIAGLGRSATARHFAINGVDEARAYLDDSLLGGRLRESARALIDLDEVDAVRIFGAVDAQKLQSSMTLFAHAAPAEPIFHQVLQKYFSGHEDAGTTIRL